MGIRDKEKSRQDIKSNVSAIVGVEQKGSISEPANSDLTQKAYYITKSQYKKLPTAAVKPLALAMGI